MCERLTVECMCGDSVSLDSPVTGAGRDLCPALLSCPRAKSCGGFPLQAEDRITNSMELLLRSVVSPESSLSSRVLNIRSHVNKYYAGWLVCEDPGCSGRTRVMPLRFQRAYPVCPVCRVSSMYQVRGEAVEPGQNNVLSSRNTLRLSSTPRSSTSTT